MYEAGSDGRGLGWLSLLPPRRSAPPGPCGLGSHFGKSFVMVVGSPPLRDQEAGDAPLDAASGFWLYSGRCPVSESPRQRVIGDLEFSWRGTPPGA